MFVIAYLANYNGMASWCWEAAHALHELGQPVLLICAEDIELPGTPAVDILRFNPQDYSQPSSQLFSRIRQEVSNLSGQPSNFLNLLHHHLQQRGIQPSAYFLNMASLQHPTISTPQYVVGWAYPTSLMGYLAKVGTSTGWSFSKEAVRTGLSFLGWWRKDWSAYRSVTAVLAVSHKLERELMAQDIRVHVVHPGTLVRPNQIPTSSTSPCKLLIAAENLEDPRKRVKWMIDALKAESQPNFKLTLAGAASDAFQHWVCSNDFPAEFIGRVPRDQLQDVMAEQDVFLFGSRLDDWGYVLVEAMGQGLSIVAPNLSPFDEIVGDAGMLYSLSSSQEFRQKVHELSRSNSLAQRQAAWSRANRLFSRPAFGQSLLTAFSETNPSGAKCPVETC